MTTRAQDTLTAMDVERPVFAESTAYNLCYTRSCMSAEGSFLTPVPRKRGYTHRSSMSLVELRAPEDAVYQSIAAKLADQTSYYCSWYSLGTYSNCVIARISYGADCINGCHGDLQCRTLRVLHPTTTHTYTGRRIYFASRV